jgi:Holliday junction resolvasome RuvABC ATP-dependent DNA helicase subunit
MGIEHDRIITATGGRDDEVVDRAVRPKTLADYIGQPNVKVSARPRSPTSSRTSSK